MKVGIFISLGIVVIIVVVTLLALRGRVDPPTRVTAPDQLVRNELPRDLPAMFVPSNPGEAANALYEQALSFFNEHQRELGGQKPGERVVEELSDKLIAAMEAGKVEEGLLDNHIPLKPAGVPSYGTFLGDTQKAVLDRAAVNWGEGRKDRAVKQALAVWALGERMLRHSVRMRNRVAGLELMQRGGIALYNWSDDPVAKGVPIEKWVDPLRDFERRWRDKLKVVMAIRPHLGDLINVAAHDQDRSYRVEAVLALGYAKFAAGHRGNLNAIHRLLKSLETSDDKLLAGAARAATDFTREELRGVKMGM